MASVRALPIFITTSMPLVTFPNTGCCEGDRSSRQWSRKSLCTVLTKNCDPPLLGWPVLAMDKVPGSFEVLSISSSGMFPPASRVIFLPDPSRTSNTVPPSGPPVPARRDLASLAKGHPNCNMNPSMTRWKWTPS